MLLHIAKKIREDAYEKSLEDGGVHHDAFPEQYTMMRSQEAVVVALTDPSSWASRNAVIDLHRCHLQPSSYCLPMLE